VVTEIRHEEEEREKRGGDVAEVRKNHSGAWRRNDKAVEIARKSLEY
jgi:hypothetical protein